MNKKNYATIEEANFIENVLKEIKSENLSTSRFNLGILYGLFFGIIGNLFVTLLFSYYPLEYLPEETKFNLLVPVALAILVFLIITIKENRHVRINERKIENNLMNISSIKKKIEKGEKISHWNLIDTQNIIEKALEKKH